MNNIDISQIATLPTKYGTFKIQAFKEGTKNGEGKEPGA